MEIVVRTALIGIGATVVMDVWALLLRSAFGVTPPNYAMVGRWLGHMPASRFAHARIASAAPVDGERALGWIAHYAIGVVFAVVLVAVFGDDWLGRPVLAPALAVGIATVTVPFLIMHPAFGLGIASSRAPNPTAARLRSVVSHAVFGLGLYLSALLLARIFPV